MKYLAALFALIFSTSLALAQASVNSPFPQSAWPTYSPSPTCTGGTFTVNNANALTFGKTTFVALNLTVSSGTCSSNTSNISIPLPNSATAAGGSTGAFEYVGGAQIFCSIQDSALNTLVCRSSIALPSTSRFSLSLAYQNQ